MPILSGAEPFVHNGSDDVGVLLCHGFTGTPQSMRPWAEHLAAEGITVRCPLLPGHGTTWQQLNRTRWTEWYRAVDSELSGLRKHGCQSLFVFGLSMGGTLALRLAQEHADIAGVVLVNPSVTTLRKDAVLLPLLSKVVPATRGVAGDIAKPGAKELAYDRMPLRAMASLAQMWRVVREDLRLVRQPLMLFRSANDHVVEPVNATIILDGISSQDVTEVILNDSFHVATLDNDATTLFRRSVEFLRRIRPERGREVRA